MGRISNIIAVVVIVAALPLFIHARSKLIEQPRPMVETIAAYPQPDLAKVMFLGYSAMAADFIFIKAAYYFGSHYVTDHTYPLLEQMIEVVARLNPDPKIALLFGDAAISSMNTPEAIAAANRLLDIGHELYPDDWNFVFRKGMNYFMYLDDMEKAYPFLYRGARMPGSPPNAYWLVTKAATKGGGYRLAYEYTLSQLGEAKERNMIALLELRVRFFSDLIALSEAAERYRNDTGKAPDRELKELVRKGYMSAIPQEPYGGHYYYDEQKEMVVTSSERTLRPPEEENTKGKKTS
ncbi:MAG TPA: hypothetical protein PLV42_03950 [bacterium]|nr:hypothetical protein [bacterium]